MESNISMEIPGCMKQHLMLFTPNWSDPGRICVIACNVYNSNLINVSRRKMQVMFVVRKIWKGLRMTNVTKTSIRIKKFLTS